MNHSNDCIAVEIASKGAFGISRLRLNEWPLYLFHSNFYSRPPIILFYFRDGGHHGGILQRQFNGLLRHHIRLGGRPVRRRLLPHEHHQTTLAQVWSLNFIGSADD